MTVHVLKKEWDAEQASKPKNKFAEIFTAFNSNSKKTESSVNKRNNKNLSDYLKKAGFVYVPVLGKFAGNLERSYMVFNISLNSIKFLSDKYQQTFFFFIKRDGQDLVVEYWEKDDVYKPYSKSRNDYMCKNTVFTVEQASEAEDFSQIAKRLKLTFPSEKFDSVHQLMPEVNQAWDIIVDGVGLFAFYRRKSLNRKALSLRFASSFLL